MVLPMKEYQKLVEDLADLAVIAERKAEPVEPLAGIKDRLAKQWRSTESR